MIIASCTGIGLNKGREMQEHLKALEEVKRIMYLIRSELQYTHAPFAEVFEKMERKTTPPFQVWLQQLARRLNKKEISSFEEMWCASISEDLKGSRLGDEELEELKRIGKNLEYTESMNLYIEQLEYKIKQTRETYRTKRKLCQSMGIMGGIFLVILLL